MTTTPDLSVIVPTRNRPGKLRACLRALSGQTYANDAFEVIVVDDGSDTPLEPVVAPFREGLRIRLVRQDNAGPARARNLGAAHAVGALLAFTDDDCEPDPGWLAALQARFLEQPDRALGGMTINGLPGNVYSTASQCLIDYLYAYYAQPADASRAPAARPFLTSNNLAMPARLFRELGGFNETFPLAAGEDRELCDRWQESGYQLVNVPDATVRHLHDLSARTFWRQHLNYGRGAFHLRSARTRRGAPALGVEPLSFYGKLLTFPLGTTPMPRGVLLMALMGISQAANALGFMLEKRRV